MKNIILFLIISSFVSCLRYDGSREFNKKMKFNGKISKIYKNEHNHFMYYFEIQSTNETIEIIAEDWPRSWEYATVGDSIIKPADTLMVIVKKNDSTFKKFLYDF